MKTTKIIAAVILIIGAVFVYAMIKGPETVSSRFVITGTDGRKITGRYTADGIEQTIEKVLPAEITIDAKRLSLSVESSDKAQDIFVQVYLNDKLKVSGGHRYVKIEVSGKTLLSSPKTHLIASNGPVP